MRTVHEWSQGDTQRRRGVDQPICQINLSLSVHLPSIFELCTPTMLRERGVEMRQTVACAFAFLANRQEVRTQDVNRICLAFLGPTAASAFEAESNGYEQQKL